MDTLPFIFGWGGVGWESKLCSGSKSSAIQHRHPSHSYQGKTEGSKQHSIYSGKEVRHRLVMPAGARGKVGSLEAMHYNLGELGGILA